MSEPRPGGLRILHVAETAKGGVGSYMDDVVTEQLMRSGVADVRVILPRAHADQLQQVPARVKWPYAAGSVRALAVLGLMWATLRAVRQWKPQVVHLHSTVAGLVLRPLLWVMPRRPRIIYCAHGWAFHREAGDSSNAKVALLERWLAACCDAVVCISEHDRRAALNIGIAPDKLELIYNGIADTPTLPPDAVKSARGLWPPGKLRVLFVGRLDRQKAANVLFEAIAPLQADVHAVVVGQAVVGDAFASATPANVHITGWLARECLPALYAAADVLVVPSRWEGFGLVAVEAMRAGKPVIASAVGGLMEVVQDGVTGHLVPVGDVAALRHVLVALQPTCMQVMGSAGRQRFVDRFRIDGTVDRLDAVYLRVLGKKVRAERFTSETNTDVAEHGEKVWTCGADACDGSAQDAEKTGGMKDGAGA